MRTLNDRGEPRPADGPTGQITRGGRDDAPGLPTHAAWKTRGTPITHERRKQTPLSHGSRRAAQLGRGNCP
eukprot:4003282-Lingulodinium_polyedra.AAC.1